MRRTSMRAPARTHDRTCHTRAIQLNDEGYSSRTEDIPCDDLRLADVASSLTTNSSHRTHAPALDLDFPAELIWGKDGLELWVDVEMSVYRYKKALEAFHRAGLGGLCGLSRKGHSLAERTAHYESVRHGARDDTAFLETLLALGPEITGSIDDAFLISRESIPPMGLRTGRALANPWRFPLVHEAHLVPSTSNFHLYLEAELSERTYFRFLRPLAKAHILEKGYYGASYSRRKTNLRLPWHSKESRNLDLMDEVPVPLY